MLIFIVVVLAVHGLVNFYILHRGWQALAGFPRLRAAAALLFLLSALAYPIGRTILASKKWIWSEFLVRIGSPHMALMLYLFMGVLAVDLLRLIDALLPFFPRFVTADPNRTGLVLFLIIFGTAALAVVGGGINAAKPRIKELDLTIAKTAPGRKNLNIVMASDVHLGTTVRSSRAEKIVLMINALHPDIVLLAGDIVDETMTAREEEKLTAAFRDIRAPLGVFAVPGNHEFYSGLERNLASLKKCGIRVLQDEAVRIDGSFVLIGRKDPSALPKGGRRIPIADILDKEGVNLGLPLVLLDHQPLHLEEAQDAGIDLQLSGHTHAGQLFPLSLINKRMYEQNWGYLRKGGTQYYVSSGVCTWGPPVRTGSVPEIVRIKMSFDRDS